MERTSDKENKMWLTRPWLVVALGFGAAAFLVRWAGLSIPIIGTGINSDPREMFIIVGSALTGPVGGLVIGFLAGLVTLFGDFGLSDVLAHMTGGLLMGGLYKWACRRWQMPIFFIVWVALVIGYYLILILAFVTFMFLLYPGNAPILFGAGTSPLQAYRLLAQGAPPEMIITLIFSSVILLALPKKYRCPLW